MSNHWYGEGSKARRSVAVEARSWGLLTALTNGFAGPLLVARGADVLALGAYNAGLSLFGLGAASVGPALARRMGDVARPALAALLLGRLALLAAAIIVVVTPGGAAMPLIGALMLWSVGEGVALPLWKSFLGGLVRPAERRQWISWRAASAAVAVAVVVPPLVVLALILPERAWQVAFIGAAVAGLVSVDRLRVLFAAAPSPPVPRELPQRWRDAGGEGRFLLANFCFWFGAGFNRPVLPPYLVHSLGATAAYFATAAAVTAICGLLAQRLWGWLAEARRTNALLGWSGLGASIVPLLWLAVPTAWLGLPVEALAASCWLGHLLGVAIRSAELAEDDALRAALLARVHLMQGIAATIAPLGAAAIAPLAGERVILAASGLVCVAASALLVELKAPGWLSRLDFPVMGLSVRRGD